MDDKHADDSFGDVLKRHGLDGDRDRWREALQRVTPAEVEAALAARPGSYSLTRLAALVSPAAEDYLETMAWMSRQLTIQRFGRTIRLYAPVYLSSYCINRCRYCGFNCENTFTRARLTVDEALVEAEILAAKGFRDILLVSSEDKQFIHTDYLERLAHALRERFSFIGIEIYQMEVPEYRRLFEAGVEGVTLYQETYDRAVYGHYHLGGPKMDFERRLRGPDDMGTAGMREIGLGVLLGLADWRVETLALGAHAHYLAKRYWQSHVSFSFPRLRPACGVAAAQFPHLIGDRNLVQMMLALRLCFADAGIVISTREPADLRDRLIELGVTRMSAGSRTNPGGYSEPEENTGQFAVSDERSPAQVGAMLKDRGFDLVWKDWDRAFIQA